jgi:CHAD domain-containing protein
MREIKWLAKILGRARDLDVFRSETMQNGTHSVNLSELVVPIELERAKAYKRVRLTLASPRYDAMKYGLSHWFNDIEHDSQPPLQSKLRDAVPEILDERYGRATKLTKKGIPDKRKKQHATRIAFKKLRYSIEIFGTLYERSMVNYFVTVLKRLQDDLGYANDIYVAHEIVGDVFPDLREAQALLHIHEDTLEREGARTQRHLERFLNAQPFWR